MAENLSIDGSKIDQVLNDIAKLILRLCKNSKKSKKEQICGYFRNMYVMTIIINMCVIICIHVCMYVQYVCTVYVYNVDKI